MHPAPGLSALETLAEVSRHHLDYSTQYPPQKKRKLAKGKSNVQGSNSIPGASAPAGYVAAEMVTGDSQAHHEQFNNLPAPNHYDPTEFLVQDDATEGRTDGNNLDQNEQGGVEDGHLTENVMDTVYDPSAAPSVPTSLQFAASAATELIMPHNITSGPFQGYSDENPEFLFTRFRSRPPPSAHVIDPQLHDGSATIEHELSKAANRLRPIARKSPVPDAALDAPKSKPKVRGRFSDSRRKEVQHTRKIGACMRCRMLKKPCSGETPCHQCTKIDSARVWRQPCIRTKIAEEFGLYTAGLFAIRAYQNGNRIKELLHFDLDHGRVEARIFANTSLFATFDVRAGRNLATPYLQEEHLEQNRTGTPEVQMIATNEDDVCGKLEEYIRKLALEVYSNECSHAVRVGLEHARKIFATTQSVLIFRTVELEICTRLLCGELSFELFYNPREPSQFAPYEAHLEIGSPPHIPITPESNKKTHELMASQLLGNVERRAATLSKNVMNELERRLLQRQQAHPFETFLVSIILLSCVQRMCALYRKLEHLIPAPAPEPDPALQGLEERLRAAAGPARSDSENNGDSKLHQTGTQGGSSLPEDGDQEQGERAAPFGTPLDAVASTNPNGWPLDKPHSFHYNQGEHFSDILIMLLKLRNIIPATTIREDGVIIVDDRIESQPIPPTEEAKEWFETMQLTEERLREMANEGGEMMYLSKILDKGWQSST